MIIISLNYYLNYYTRHVITMLYNSLSHYYDNNDYKQNNKYEKRFNTY